MDGEYANAYGSKIYLACKPEQVDLMWQWMGVIGKLEP
jgi:hypothetical protein